MGLGVEEYCKMQLDLSPRLRLLIHSFKGNPLELTPNKFIIKEVLKLTELTDKIEIMISFPLHFFAFVHLFLFTLNSSHLTLFLLFTFSVLYFYLIR